MKKQNFWGSLTTFAEENPIIGIVSIALVITFFVLLFVYLYRRIKKIEQNEKQDALSDAYAPMAILKILRKEKGSNFTLVGSRITKGMLRTELAHPIQMENKSKSFPEWFEKPEPFFRIRVVKDGLLGMFLLVQKSNGHYCFVTEYQAISFTPDPEQPPELEKVIDWEMLERKMNRPSAKEDWASAFGKLPNIGFILFFSLLSSSAFGQTGNIEKNDQWMVYLSVFLFALGLVVWFWRSSRPKKKLENPPENAETHWDNYHTGSYP
jgi:hypothetical protein